MTICFKCKILALSLCCILFSLEAQECHSLMASLLTSLHSEKRTRDLLGVNHIKTPEFEAKLREILLSDTKSNFLIPPIQTHFGRISLKVNLKASEVTIQSSNKELSFRLESIFIYARTMTQRDFRGWKLPYHFNENTSTLKIHLKDYHLEENILFLENLISRIFQEETKEREAQFFETLLEHDKRKKLILKKIEKQIQKIDAKRLQKIEVTLSQIEKMRGRFGEIDLSNIDKIKHDEIKKIDKIFDQKIEQELAELEKFEFFISDFIKKELPHFAESYVHLNVLLNEILPDFERRHRKTQIIKAKFSTSMRNEIQKLKVSTEQEFMDSFLLYKAIQRLEFLERELFRSKTKISAGKQLKDIRVQISLIQKIMENHILHMSTTESIF